MTRTKAILAIFVTVLMLGAVAASAASAAWFVGGSELTEETTVAIATTAKVESYPVLSVPTVGIELECTAANIKAQIPVITGGTNTVKGESVTLEGCSTIKPTSGCELESSSVTTVPAVALVTLRAGHAPADLIDIEPQAGKTFAEIAFSIEDTCAFAGEQPIKGQVLVNAPTGQSEEELQAIEGLDTAEGNNSLEVGKDKAYIVGGRGLLKLASGSKWSFK